jgi:hypothetical protein
MCLIGDADAVGEAVRAGQTEGSTRSHRRPPLHLITSPFPSLASFPHPVHPTTRSGWRALPFPCQNPATRARHPSSMCASNNSGASPCVLHESSNAAVRAPTEPKKAAVVVCKRYFRSGSFFSWFAKEVQGSFYTESYS